MSTRTRTLRAPAEGGAWRLTTKVVREHVPEITGIGERLRGPADAAAIMHALYDDCPQEVFVVFLLNSRHRIVAFQEVTRGTVDASLVHAREIFREAIRANAAGIIIAHNHPSGDPTPSAEDRAVTRQLAEAGRTVGIPLLDHVVIGAYGGYASLASEVSGRLPAVGFAHI